MVDTSNMNKPEYGDNSEFSPVCTTLREASEILHTADRIPDDSTKAPLIEGATKMRTARHRGREKSRQGFKGVDGKLRTKQGARRRMELSDQQGGDIKHLLKRQQQQLNILSGIIQIKVG